jgi:hypothetical protein
MITPAAKTFIPDPKSFDDPIKLRKLMANAWRLGHDDLAFRCQLRIGEIAGAAYKDALEREFWVALVVAEEFKTQANGKTSRLAQTRQKFTRAGVEKALADWAGTEKPSDGLLRLVEGGRGDLSAEAALVRHADRFAALAVDSATAKLAAHNVALDGEATEDEPALETA